MFQNDLCSQNCYNTTNQKFLRKYNCNSRLQHIALKLPNPIMLFKKALSISHYTKLWQNKQTKSSYLLVKAIKCCPYDCKKSSHHFSQRRNNFIKSRIGFSLEILLFQLISVLGGTILIKISLIKRTNLILSSQQINSNRKFVIFF